MNTNTPTARHEVQGQTLAKIQSAVFSLMIALPAGLASYMMMDTRTDWPHAPLVTVGVLSLMVSDFLVLLLIEPYRSRLGDMTIPAILSFIGTVMFFLVTETLDRFVVDYGFHWLTPIVVTSLLILYGSVFREKNLPLKLFLGLNGLVLTVLWSLGDVDKVTLPF